jgi:hypothetical protein
MNYDDKQLINILIIVIASCPYDIYISIFSIEIKSTADASASSSTAAKSPRICVGAKVSERNNNRWFGGPPQPQTRTLLVAAAYSDIDFITVWEVTEGSTAVT